MSNVSSKTNKDVSVKQPKKSAEKPINLKKTTEVRLTNDTIVNVVSNCFGKLIWVAKDGYKTTWDKHGDSQELTIGELREMKASSSRFFSDNWIIITGFAHGQDVEGATPADIYKTLGVLKFYGDTVNPDGYKNAFRWTEKEIRENVATMTRGAKENLVVAVRDQISEGKIDSIKKIELFEEVLGCEIRKFE